MSEWKRYKLGEFVEIEMGQSPKGIFTNTDKVGLPLLNGPSEFGSHNPTPIQFTTDPKKLALKSDLLFCVRGSTTGRMNWADQRYAIGRGIAAFRHKSGPDYKYFLKGLIDYNLKNILSVATGSTFPNVGRKQLLGFEVQVPDLPTQRRIAAILSSLDDKIELNLQMNQTLENMAQAIFKEWFVDFNFPGFDGQLVDGLPKEWRKGSILEISRLISGGTPKTKNKNYWNGSVNWIAAKDISGNNRKFIFETEKKITEEGISNSAAKLLPEHATIISARGTVGNICIISKEMAISQSNYGLKSNNNFDYFTFLMAINMISMMKSYSYGTVFDTITTKTFNEMEIVIPTDKVIEEFESTVSSLFTKIKSAIKDNMILSQTRDTLLPKLMSGQINVA